MATRERLILAAATLVAAASRLFAMARTPWDWDELLFMRALGRYDVASHRPHPPGFPLFVLAGKVLRKLFGLGDFQALQALSVVAAVLIVPAMFALCRALGMRFSTSISAAMILAFFPNVWFYGGTAFSDVPSMVLVIAAVALLLRGKMLTGSAALAVAAGFRPQNLVVGVAAWLLAAFGRGQAEACPPAGSRQEPSGGRASACPGRAVAGAILLAAIVAASYGAAAWLTGWQRYRRAVTDHGAYISTVDSFRAQGRPPLWRLIDDFFVHPYQAPLINAIVTALVVIALIVGLIQRRRHVLVALASFGPFCLMALLLLDHFSASRFSIGYAPLIALLVAEGVALVARRFEPVAAAALVALMIGWTWPAIDGVRHSIAPPVAALDWVRNHADPRTSVIYVDVGLIPYAEWYLPEYRLRFVEDAAPPAAWVLKQPGFYVREGSSNTAHAVNFVRPHGRVWDVARRRYFEASVAPIAERVIFGAGWHEQEEEKGHVWRWMSGRSVAQLPPVPGDGRLTLGLYAPLDALPASPNVTVRVNGQIVDRFTPTTSYFQRELVVHGRAGAPNELVIETDRLVPESLDARMLGLRLNSLGWTPKG
jgi:DIE2/ALG10 family